MVPHIVPHVKLEQLQIMLVLIAITVTTAKYHMFEQTKEQQQIRKNVLLVQLVSGVLIAMAPNRDKTENL